MAHIKGPVKKGPLSIRSRQRRISPRPIASTGYFIPQAAYKNVRLLLSPDALPPCSTSPLFCTLAQRRITICSHPFLRSTCATICPTHQSCLCLASDAIPISTQIASVRTEPTPAPYRPYRCCTVNPLPVCDRHVFLCGLTIAVAQDSAFSPSAVGPPPLLHQLSEGTRSMHLPPSVSFISRHDRCLQCFECTQCNDSIPSRSNRADHTGIGRIRRPIAAY